MKTMNDIINKVIQLDPTMWYIIGCILVALIIFALIKKAVKIAILIAAIAIIYGLFSSPTGTIPGNYGFNYEEGVINLTLDGKTTEINTTDLQDMRVEEGETDEYFIRYIYKGEEKEIAIPKFLVSTAREKIQQLQEDIRKDEESGV